MIEALNLPVYEIDYSESSNTVALNAQKHTLAHYSIEAVTNKISKAL